MSAATATGVQADRPNRILMITWSDGHTSRISFDGLRLACPCVECKGGHQNMGTVPAPSEIRNAPVTNLQLENLIPVGTYALQPQWSDGHDTGIYTWKLLRHLDPPAAAGDD